MERSPEGWDISVHDCVCEKGCCLRIARNRTGSIFRPNNDYWKRSCMKIIKGVPPGLAGILACAISYSKKVAVSKSREIAWVAYLGQITNIRNGRTWKLLKERSRDDRETNMRDCACEKGCRLKIAGNRTGSIFRPNNGYWKRSRAKIIIGALFRGLGYYNARLHAQKRLPSQNCAKSYKYHILAK